MESEIEPLLLNFVNSNNETTSLNFSKTSKALARPKQSLENHLLGVAEKSKKFAAKIGLAEQGELIGLMHDFGKYSQAFQNYILSAAGKLNCDIDEDYVDVKAKKGKIDHSTAGAQWIWNKLKKFRVKGEGQLCAQILALCVVSHHSGLIDCLNPETLDPKEINTFRKRINKLDELTHYEECQERVDKNIVEKAHQLVTHQQVAGMLNIITRIYKSSKELDISNFYLGLLSKFLFSCLIDADRIDSASVENPIYNEIQNRHMDWSIGIERLEKALRGFSADGPVNQLRQKISQNCLKKSSLPQGIYTLTVPTGGGKTFASLRYALHHARQYNLERIIYVIPYTSIIEQNADAIRELIENEQDEFPWVLEQHSNLEPEKQTWHSKLVSDNWDSPIILTTMVQFLEVLFGGGTRGVRRMHQLANSILIFDEIQTLPIKCVHLFCNAINFLTSHTKTTAVLCTATQPLLTQLKTPHKGQLIIPKENELVDDQQEVFYQLERVEIINHYKIEGWSEIEIAELMLEELQQKGNCLVIVNTKEWAKKLYQRCKGKVADEALFHLSTYQYPAHRKKIFARIRQRLEDKLPVLCISTQLIEAGVDIDFASVIRFLAGLDSIAQAAGRCNRNGTLKNSKGELIKGSVHVVNPDSESLESLIDIKAGREATKTVLSKLPGNQLLNPESIELYFKYYFFDRADQMDYPLSGGENLLNMLSSNNLNVGKVDCEGKWPILQQSFMAAGKIFKGIDAPTQAVIIQHDEGKEIVAELCGLEKTFNPKEYYELLRKAQRYSVNVFPNIWKKLEAKQAVIEIQNYGIYFLDERYYSDEYGLSEDPVTSMSSLVV